MAKKNYDISVIVPFKDKAKMTLDCIRSFRTYGPTVKEILLVSNNSKPPEIEIIRDYIKDFTHIKLVEYNKPFNYQKLNNWAVEQTSGEYLLFLNNDTELRSESVGMIERMYEKSTKEDVGITGCLLLYGDAAVIQHAGVFLMPNGLADHMYVGKKYSKALQYAGTSSFPYDVREDRPMTAVTGAISLIERRKFEAVNGFDERFIVGGGDVDLCIRLNKAGYQTWFVSGGFLLHKESQSRKANQTPVTFNDFYYSYLSYITGYNAAVGDPFLPEITRHM